MRRFLAIAAILAGLGFGFLVEAPKADAHWGYGGYGYGGGYYGGGWRGGYGGWRGGYGGWGPRSGYSFSYRRGHFGGSRFNFSYGYPRYYYRW